nr:hypothetical protein [Nanchangia anserum]
MAVDSTDGSVTTLKHDGFLRLTEAGDGRHVMVADDKGFSVLDSGLAERPHGDHSHYYEGPAAFTDVAFAAKEPGHVVHNAGQTALYADASGEAMIFPSGAIHDNAEPSELRHLTASNPHHGVAVPLAEGRVLMTEGTEKERHSIVLYDREGKEVTRTDECPGVHGVAEVGDGSVVSFGCENGPVVFRDGQFHKVASTEAYQRTGNQRGSEHDRYVLTDYKVDKDADLERPTRVGILDTAADTMRTVDLGSPYWFRSLERGPNGEGVVLTYNGKLNIIDMAEGRITKTIDVVGEWSEDKEWQKPNVAVRVLDDIAYVSDPHSKKLHMVGLGSGKVIKTVDLPQVPNEIAVVDGHIPAGVSVAEATETD